MPYIHVTTFIAAPQQVVFDLSRHIGLHKISQQNYGEDVVNGVAAGLIKEGESVTWKAKHLWKERMMTVTISEMKPSSYFEDVMTKGDFLSFSHKHHFKQIVNGTIMIDELSFETPYKFIGDLVNRFYLKHYMKKLLEERNAVIREYAEGNKWKALLEQ